MITPERLAEAFADNLGILQMQVKGLSHQDSLLQPPFRGNSLNWVLGHILESRNGVLGLLGEQEVMTKAEAARYGYGSEPVTGEGPGVLRLEDLLTRLERAQERIAAGLKRAKAEDLAQERDFGWRKATVGDQAFFLYFHETYHTGQTEYLRQLAGTNDKVI